MPRQNAPFLSFNHGLVSKLALARVDASRLRFAAETMTNWVPRTVGPMMLRPGFGFVNETKSNASCKLIPYIRSVDTSALIEVTGAAIRFHVNDELVTRVSVGTSVPDGEFTAGGSWTLTNTGGATSSDNTGSLMLYALPFNSTATAYQAISVAGGDTAKRHAVRIDVTRGPVDFRIGTSAGSDDIIGVTTLGRGTHSLAFTPNAGTIYLQFDSTSSWQVFVERCIIESAGTLELPTPWGGDFTKLRPTPSADVIFIACDGYQQRKIERRAADSWSIVYYEANDGPFDEAAAFNAELTPTGIRGTILVNSDVPFFYSGQEGSLLRLTITNQVSQGDLGDDATFTDTIRVTGVSKVKQVLSGSTTTVGATSTSTSNTTQEVIGGTRYFYIQLSGTWSGTVTLQRSVDGEDSGFVDVKTWTGNISGTESYSDDLDNIVAWYRMGFKSGDYTSGTATATLYFPGGGGAGVVRIESLNSSQQAVCSVMSRLSAAAATRDWQLGSWSEDKGFPSASSLYLGRLWWAGFDKIWGSISDAFDSFDEEVKGDAGTLARSIGYGPIQNIHWMLPLGRLILGSGGSEVAVRTSSTDEPITPTNFGLRDISTQGSAPIAGIKIDTRGLFVQRSKRRIYQLSYDPNAFDYVASDLTALLPDLTADFVAGDVGRQSDTRVYFVCSDGAMLVNLFEPAEEVQCWYRIETPGASGFIEEVCVLPGHIEDQVYVVVRRTINGSTKRYIEKLARMDQAIGGSTATLADSYVYYTGAGTTTITGLSHLEGQEVVVWGNGKDLGTKTVASGQITGLSEAVSSACVGLAYGARFKSAKLAYAAAEGTPVTQRKRVSYLGLVLKDTHCDGLYFGPDFDTMDPLPRDVAGADVADHTVHSDLDLEATEFPGEWSTDSRLCLLAEAPKPCTVCGAVITVVTNEKPIMLKGP